MFFAVGLSLRIKSMGAGGFVCAVGVRGERLRGGALILRWVVGRHELLLVRVRQLLNTEESVTCLNCITGPQWGRRRGRRIHTVSFRGTAKSQDPRPPWELLGGVNCWPGGDWWFEATAIGRKHDARSGAGYCDGTNVSSTEEGGPHRRHGRVGAQVQDGDGWI